MINWMDYLSQAVEHHASDLFFIAGSPVCEKTDGHIKDLGSDVLSAVDTEQIIRGIYEQAHRDILFFLKNGDDDFSFSVPGLARFRVNTYRQRGSMTAVIRLVSFEIPDWRSLNIPTEVMALSEIHSGMILITGVAGSGKSTTQACIIDRINQTRSCHIITLEDPIEYLHRHRQSIVSQREIAIDTQDYLSALRSCLRQAPDVILLGEMRDPETIRTAMTAAETGHTIITTLHTKGAVNAIDRIIDTFPSNQQEQIRIQLSSVLRTVVSQQLLPDIDGRQIVACEIMHMNNAIKSMIRENKNYQIDNTIIAGAKEGMISMDQSILSLYRSGRITQEVALEYSDHPEQLLRMMHND